MLTFFDRRTVHVGLTCALGALTSMLGCEPSPVVIAGSCRAESDCDSSESCVDGRCRPRPPTDAGPMVVDSGSPSVDAGPYARPFCPSFPFGTDACDDPEVVEHLQMRDSDDDGLLDFVELCDHGTDPCDEDSDGDGVSDLVEVGYGSDALDPEDNPRRRGDFVFVVPYSPPSAPPIEPDPTRDALSFGTDLQKVDVYVTIDTSGSMRGEMDNLRSSFRSTIVPELASRIPDVWFGAGRFEDCPQASCPNGMNNMQDMTPDVDRVQAALDTLTNTCGGREPYYQTLWLLATGDTSSYDGRVQPIPRRCDDAGTIGWPCFRPDAVRVIVQAGDEPMARESGGCPSRYPGGTHAAAAAALDGADIRYVGIDSSASSTLRDEMRQMAIDTGAVDATTGEPIYFRIPSDGSGLGEDLVRAIVQLTENVPIRVDARADNDPGNEGGVDAVEAFVLRLETNTSEASVEGRLCTDLPTGDDTGDGFPDHFPRVFPGTSVCFDIVPRPNQTVPAIDEPQLFRATVRVIGDGFTPLDEREVLFLVPPRAPTLE
ncbi:MAG: hypothetical protein RLP09_02065 [Sandaracinaceae bacterium]